MRQPVFAVIAVAWMAHAPQAAQDTADLDVLLDRLGAYVAAYETELSTVIAEEHYEQLVPERLEQAGASLSAQSSATTVRRMRKRVLESDVAFLRLPGNAEWFGVRDVKKVDGKAVEPGGAGRLLDLVPRFNETRLAAAAAIVVASAKHNIGSMRTINMPTVPLEVVRLGNHARFVFNVRGIDRIAGVRTRRLDFEEFDTPTIVQGPEGEPLMSHGSVWIEPDSGRVWRIEFIASPETRDYRLRRLYETKVRVDFALDPKLELVVPKEMFEEFYSPRGRGEGRAKYANYRRFTTAGRVVPQ